MIFKDGTADEVTYYYVLNLQGDVEKIIDANGVVQAIYSYDPWGKILSITSGTGASVNDTHIAKLNGLRYRGYHGDNETQWYYLQSRYYDPFTRRFVNADSYTSTGAGILGTNMFAYCNNNPIAYRDDSGEAIWPTTVAINEGSRTKTSFPAMFGAHADISHTQTIYSHDILNLGNLVTIEYTSSLTSLTAQSGNAGALIDVYAFQDTDINALMEGKGTTYGAGISALSLLGIEAYVMWFGVGIKGTLYLGNTEIYVDGTINLDNNISASIGITQHINSTLSQNHELSINGNASMAMALIGYFITGYYMEPEYNYAYSY